MSFIKNIKRYIKIKNQTKTINKIISNYKYIHITNNDKFIAPFVSFSNKYFDKNEHLFLSVRTHDFPFPSGENVYEVIKLDGLNLANKNINKIIIHSLFVPKIIDYLYSHKNILQKSYWVIWGGDLYNAERDEKNDYVRRNFKGYISVVEGDEIVAKNKFKSNPLLFSAPYATPVTKNMLDNVIFYKSKCINIQINNSCDKSTLDMLNILSKFKDKNIKITTILSYGKLQYKQDIIKKGKEIFNEKFEYIEDYLAPKDYAQHIANIDIMILNQNRQQGVGNVLISAYYGKKIFIKSEVTTVKYLHNLGINVFDTNTIKNLSFSEFVSTKEEYKIKNKTSTRKYYDNSLQIKQWSEIFNKEKKVQNE